MIEKAMPEFLVLEIYRITLLSNRIDKTSDIS